MSNTQLLTADETADYLKVSKATIWQWCRSGRLPAVKIGRQWRIRRKDLEEMLAAPPPDSELVGGRGETVVLPSASSQRKGEYACRQTGKIIPSSED